MLKTVAAFFCLFACAFVSANDSDMPKPCNSDRQYEAGVQIVNNEGKVSGRSGLIEGKMSYDADNERVATVGYNYHRGLHIRLLQMFGSNLAYVIFLSNNTCKASEMVFPLAPSGVPSTAMFVNSYLLGSMSHGFQVNQWLYTYKSLNKSDGDSEMKTWNGHYTDEGCIPIRYEIFKGNLAVPPSEREETLELFSIYFSNYKTGIADHSVFDVPANCPQESSDFLLKEEVMELFS